MIQPILAMVLELGAGDVFAQESLPFPPTPSASIAGRSIKESLYQPGVETKRLPADAPNILIILMDDVGARADAFRLNFVLQYDLVNLEKLAKG